MDYLDEPTSSQTPEPETKSRWGRRLFLLGLLALAVFLFVHTGLAKLVLQSRVFSFDTRGGARLPELFKPEKDRVDVLLLGIRGADDPNGGLLADTIMLVSYQPSTERAAFISIPRDLWVEIPDHGFARINFGYALGEEKKGRGIEYMRYLASNVTGINIDYTISLDFTAFKEVIDVIGGVEVNVEKPLVETTQFQGVPLIFNPGKQEMDGDRALYYVRARYSTSDFDRARRQQEVLLAIREKALTLGVLANPAKLSAIYKAVSKHVKTDASLGDLLQSASILSTLRPERITRAVLNDSPEGLLYATNVNGAYALFPLGETYENIHERIRGIFETRAAT
ncbi:LCP family protein, partial [Candidatus Azambacteria bacterium]|nr:LCP family protein [Candidatus Azambacteria bacterium]